MTTFQALVYAFIHATTQFLPIGARAHEILIPYLTGWPQPTGPVLGALTLGCLLALLIYFRHDWASMISSLIQIIVFRRRPMTMDERMPLFIAVSTLPVLLAISYFGDTPSEFSGSIMVVTPIFAGMGLALWFFDFFGRKSKGMADWNWVDAFWIGLCQVFSIFPGWDFFTAALVCALFLNYRRESAVKYAYFAATPILLTKTITHLRDLNLYSSAPTPDLSWLSFGVALVVTTLTGLLILGGFMKNIQQKSLNQYVIYRWVLGAGVCVMYWLRM